MELRRGGVGSQAVGLRMDGDSRDGGGGGGGCKDAGSEDYENLPTSASLSTHMTAGAMAGILEHSVMYPVDSVKVRCAEPFGDGASRGERARACVCIPRNGSAPKPPSSPRRGGRGARRPGSPGAGARSLARGARRAAPSTSRLGSGAPPESTRVLQLAPAPRPRPRLLAALRREKWRPPLVSVLAAGSRGRRSVQPCTVLLHLHARSEGFGVPAQLPTRARFPTEVAAGKH